MADSPPPPPGKADALNVEPAVMIAAAAKPIAILRIMMLLHLLGDAPQPFRIKPQRLRLRLQRAAVSLGVPASESQPQRSKWRCSPRNVAYNGTIHDYV